MKIQITDLQFNRLSKKGIVREQIKSPTAPNISQTFEKGTNPYTPPPVDWQREQEPYKAFNEPLGRVDTGVRGKYKNFLPAQTNKYYWDPNYQGTTTRPALDQYGRTFNQTIQTRGSWMYKSLKNVDEWRDVPAGYYPPDYEKALEFQKTEGKYNKQFKDSPRGPEYAVSDATRVNRGVTPLSAKKNPYYNPEFPLGMSQMGLKAYNAQTLAANQEMRDFKNSAPKQVAGSDYFASLNAQTRKKSEMLISQKVNSELDRIKSQFGYYVKEQEAKGEEGFDWLGFLLTVASILPVVGPVATVVNIGYNLNNAIKYYEKGDMAQAGLNLLFAAVPTASRFLKDKNVLNIIAAGGKEAQAIERVLAQNADKWMGGAVTNLGQAVERNLPAAIAQYGDKKALETVIERGVGKFTEKYSLKGASKATANEIDKFRKGETDDINPLNSYVPS